MWSKNWVPFPCLSGPHGRYQWAVKSWNTNTETRSKLALAYCHYEWRRFDWTDLYLFNDYLVFIAGVYHDNYDSEILYNFVQCAALWPQILGGPMDFGWHGFLWSVFEYCCEWQTATDGASIQNRKARLKTRNQSWRWTAVFLDF